MIYFIHTFQNERKVNKMTKKYLKFISTLEILTKQSRGTIMPVEIK